MPEPATLASDPELERIVSEEQACLERVERNLGARPTTRNRRTDASDYDARLLDLRDQIAAARAEDLPPLVQEMERLQALATRLREIEEVTIDRRSPYFGRLVLEENGKRREVLIGRATYLDTKSDVRIVDWRDAPVSRLYYRYDEGDEYDEVFGGREVTGTVAVRRSLGITDAELRRIGAPQGTFLRGSKGGWRRIDQQASRLHGGAGTAIRAEQHRRPGKLGLGNDSGEDKTLKEVTALIDRRQFELITRPDAGLVVIQGGAGSGKTTIGLHRLAFLAFRDTRRFRPDKMLVIVFNDALVRYIAGVLPALGVSGVTTRTYGDWAARTRHGLYPRLPSKYHEDTPSVVTRLKKHPALLGSVRDFCDARVKRVESELTTALAGEGEAGKQVLASLAAGAGKPLVQRFHALGALATTELSRALSTNGRVAIERISARAVADARDVPAAWAELLTDRGALRAALERSAPGAFTAGELERAHAWCALRCGEVMAELDTESGERRGRNLVDREDEEASRRSKKEDEDDVDLEIRAGIDGREIAERARLDVEDDTLLLLLHQALRGHLTRGGTTREPIIYEHILVDEAQDLSPLELSVVLGTASKAKSVTLAGDVQQRMLMDNGFSDWNTVLDELGFSHIEIEPLKLSYRSTHEILDFSRAVLGPLAAKDAPAATRHGAPVELFELGHAGDAAAFLAEALRDLSVEEPTASIAIVARFPEQADVYFEALQRAEVRGVRRVAEQDFSFKPGIDVTDVRQVKGLEFDYVVLVDVTDTSHPDDDEARHLLHIGATRAAHQLWVLTGGKPSPLLPRELLERAGIPE
ncbi:MAG TPA: ATP-binding domain-containing protein [Polyangiaceae bacterium]|nr:ATP-binding domain-containing protein [Polyangiaceae bacterium]